MKPEETAEIILWDWLKNKSSNIQEVYLNRKNKVAAPIFKVSGLQEKPDMIIEIDDGYGIKYYAIEVKSSKNSLNITHADKIIYKYFQNYITSKTKYLIGEEEIEIKGFLIASDKSIKGHLFRKEVMIDNRIKEEGLSKFCAATKYKIIPEEEGSRTFVFIRDIWRDYGKIRNNYNFKLDCGILIANTKDNFKPYMMITNYNKIKKRWSQRWWKL